MYDKEHILIGREVMMKKQSGWNGYSLIWFLSIDLVFRATFKLTRDSQGAARSTTDFEDFRTSFRDKREPYFPLSCLINCQVLFWKIGHIFEPICNKRSTIWSITAVTLSFPCKSGHLYSFSKFISSKAYLYSRYPGRQTEYHELEKFIHIMRNPKIQSELVR